MDGSRSPCPKRPVEAWGLKLPDAIEAASAPAIYAEALVTHDRDFKRLVSMKERFDLNLLRVLVTLHRCGSVSRAAAELDLSQPATSLALGRLRKGLGDPLFVRSPKGMLPTPRCVELVEAAEMALADVTRSALQPPSFDPVSAQRDFVVTTTDVGELDFLPKLMAHLIRAAPLCNLRCAPFATEDMETALEEGRCDMAIGSFPHLERSTLHTQMLFTHSLVCLVRADHPDVPPSRISLRRFLKLPHAVIHQIGRSHEPIEVLLRKKGYRRRIQVISENLLSIPAIIAATDLIVTLPRSVADYYVRLEHLRIVEPPFNISPFALKLFWHQRFHRDPGLRWLREAVVQLFGVRY